MAPTLIFSAPVLIWGLYLTFKRNPEAPDIGDLHRVPEGSRPVYASSGLRELSADEVVMLPGAESGWEEAEALAERVRREVGVPVVEVEAPRR